MKDNKVYFPSLDGLRFIAFLLVYFQHSLQDEIHKDTLPAITKSIVRGLFETGEQGISIYFVLSGFLITYLLLKERSVNSKVNIKLFYVRRILRIWPLFYFILIFGFIIYPFIYHLMGHNVIIYNSVFYNLAFLNNFDFLHIMKDNPEHVFPIISVTWSVGIEEQFYILWPLLFYFFPGKKLLRVMFFILLGSLLFRLWYYNDGLILYFHSIAIFGDLVLGGIVAYYAFFSQRFKNFFAELNTPSRVAFYAIGIAIFLLRNIIFQFGLGEVVCRLILTSFYAFIILDQCFNKSAAFKLSSNKFMSKWGRYTYGLYLLHRVALWIILVILDKYHFLPFLSKYYFAALAFFGFLLSMLLGYISYHYYEAYFLRLKQKFGSMSKTIIN
jgi:peptidoglycan/LPS O-acetylase OafA/YrhL